jgi:transposase
MLTLPASVRIFIAAEPVDLRRGFDGLAATTRSLIRHDPSVDMSLPL